MTAYYFVITTFATVGYGDITPTNTFEKIYVMVMELFGIVSYSYAISSLTTLIQQFNKYDEKLKQKLDMLEEIQRD